MWGRVEEDMTAVRCGVESERATLGADDPRLGADHGRTHESARQTEYVGPARHSYRQGTWAGCDMEWR
jgi:hypothetical protein